MSFADLVPSILSSLTWLCRIVLVFYLLRVMVYILFGKSTNDPNRLREAMAMAYTISASWFILQSTNAIFPFVQNILDSVVIVRPPPTSINNFLVLCSGLVCTAFICNFSRSLWMLKILDHGIFHPVPDWAKLLNSSWLKKFFEFSTRTAAALLFIVIELKLERLAKFGLKKSLENMTAEVAPHIYLAAAARFGIVLYVILGLWWISGLLIAKEKMPRKLLLFYIGGLANSVFIFLYGGRIPSQDKAFWLLISIALVALFAIYMLIYVFIDICKGSKELVQRLRLKNGNSLADTQ